MSEAPPISQQAPSRVERGDAPASPLGPEFLARAEAMASHMLGGLIAVSPVQFTAESAAEAAVAMAMAVANEVRKYRLVDGRAVKNEENDA